MWVFYIFKLTRLELIVFIKKTFVLLIEELLNKTLGSLSANSTKPQILVMTAATEQNYVETVSLHLPLYIMCWHYESEAGSPTVHQYQRFSCCFPMTPREDKVVCSLYTPHVDLSYFRHVGDGETEIDEVFFLLFRPTRFLIRAVSAADKPFDFSSLS